MAKEHFNQVSWTFEAVQCILSPILFASIISKNVRFTNIFVSFPAGTKRYCIWLRAPSSKLSNHLPVFSLKRQLHFESSNEMIIPGIRSFLKAWPITGISNFRLKPLNVFILFCSKQRWLLAIYITENVIQLDFNINIAVRKQ